MAADRKTIGKGITARTVESYSGDNMQPAFDRFAERRNAALAETGSDFGADMFGVDRMCRLYENFIGPLQPESLEDYARRIARAIEATRRHIAANDADSAARAAVDVNRLITEASMKGRWEAHALRGAKIAANLKAARTRKNTKAQDDAKRRHAQWRSLARGMSKHLSDSAKAKRVAAKTGGNVDTIRKIISK